MRKLIYSINFSIDGCCDHNKAMVPDEEGFDYYTALMRGAGTLLYGRITYQLMVPYWPEVAKKQSSPRKDINEFAQAFAAVNNIVVVSKSLAKVAAENTRIVRTNLEEEILALKQEEGGNILLGGVNLPSQLLHTGLIDEYHFVVQPVIVGEGRRLFNGVSLPQRLQLTLADSKVFKSGCVALRYVKG